MRLFTVKRGTHTWLAERAAAGNWDVDFLRPWHVREDQTFERHEILADPVSAHNATAREPAFMIIASKGNYVFVKGGDLDAKYALVVPFDSVEVI